MRGIQWGLYSEECRGRITPACAGNTNLNSIRPSACRDHPRVCGEYQNIKHIIEESGGSPPRVRGILEVVPVDEGMARITPACAGNTRLKYRIPLRLGDHPRVCGEYRHFLMPILKRAGSPPRVRGIHAVNIKRAVCAGITPACAGNTQRCAARRPENGDHPRVCGEYSASQVANSATLGSPPRVRGIPVNVFDRHVGDGITPACAGNTHRDYDGVSWSGDHPRVCGEYGQPNTSCS